MQKNLDIKLLMFRINKFVFFIKQYVSQFSCIICGLKIERGDLKGVPKKLGVKTQIHKRYEKNDMFSKMHTKDAFWVSLFFKIFSRTIIVISRR